jgi:iron(III) transport system substrate-binding protein
MRKSRRWTIAAVASLVGVFAVDCFAIAQSADAYLQDLYAKAKTAGQTEITIYAASSADNRPVYDAFQKLFPTITVKSIDIFGPPLQSRLQAEFASTGPQADLVASGEPDMLILRKNGWLQSFIPDTAKGLPDQLIGPDNSWIDYASIPLGGIVNKNMVTPADAPKSWKDMVNPAWRGKTAVSNPGAINGFSQALAAGLKAGVIDQAWLEALAANKPLINPGAVATLQMVVTGQAAFAPIIAYAQYLTAKGQGAPLEFVWPAEGYTALPAPVGLLNKASHAEAAKLLMAWMMTPAAQEIFSKTVGQPGTMPGAPPLSNLPAGTNTTRFILDWRYLQDKYPDLLAGFKKTFGT